MNNQSVKMLPKEGDFREVPALKKVAIQGAHGSFHELAAMKYFGPHIECVECLSFKEVFRRVMNGEADFGITAIENTVAGTILPNYAMLRTSHTEVIGEVYLHIQQNLLALKGQTMEDIQEIHSHPMALLQCHNFFEQYPRIRLVETEDTAASARWISEKQLTHTGAIAGAHVANIYNLQLIARGIETHKRNFTRFLVIQNIIRHSTLPQPAGKITQPSLLETTKEIPNKSSLCFAVTHKKGSLAKALTQLAAHDINLTKIQSLPIVGREWEYYIHVDMEFEDYENYQLALSALTPSLTEIKILGEYRRGEKENLSPDSPLTTDLPEEKMKNKKSTVI